MSQPEKKRQLHNSQMEMQAKCPYKFYRKFIRGDAEPIGYSLALGISTHDAVAAVLRLMATLVEPRTDGPMPAYRLNRPADLAAVQELASAASLAAWSKGVELDDDLAAQGPDAARGQLEDDSVGLVSCYAEEIAPGLTVPVLGPDGRLGIEWPWVVDCPGWPYDLAGRMDVIGLSRGGRGFILRDTKTTAKSPTLTAARDSHQLSMYSLAMQVVLGSMPRAVFQDYLIRPSKTMGPRSRTLESRRNAATNEAMKLRIQTAMHTIEKGSFPPCNPGEWWCDQRYCGFHRDESCPYVRGWAQIPVFDSPAPKKEKGNGKSKPTGTRKRSAGADAGSLFGDTL